MVNQVRYLYQFRNFTIDDSERLLRYNSEIVLMSPKVFDLLYIFVTHSGVLLEKEELMTMLWRDSFVEESNLTYTISILRKVLAEHDASQKYIETFSKHGYRFVVEVKKIEAVASEQAEIPPLELMVKEEKKINLPPASLTSAPFYLRYWKAGLILVCLALVGSVIWLNAARKKHAKSEAETNLFLSASRPNEDRAVKSIAVLPFKKLTSNGDDEYIGVGIADTLINRLSNLRQMQVRPIGAVLAYADPQQDALAAGREQKVDAVLEGYVQHIGNQLRVSVRLLRVSDGVSLWADTYNFAWKDIFTTQDLIADQILQTLALKLT